MIFKCCEVFYSKQKHNIFHLHDGAATRGTIRAAIKEKMRSDNRGSKREGKSCNKSNVRRNNKGGNKKAINSDDEQSNNSVDKSVD